MNTRVHAELKAPAKAPVPPAHASRLQRKAVSSGSSAGHNFSRVPIYSAVDHHAVFIDGPDEGTKTTPPPQAPQKPAKGACPTNITVAKIDQINAPADFGKKDNEVHTGFGAIASMEVSDSGGNDWDGTSVKETVKQTSNSCGARARDVCSNKSGEDADFKVGAEVNFLGRLKMPARKNTLYDLHMFTHPDSVLHKLEKNTCEVTCSQIYKCGGKQLGPEFVITYSATKDEVANLYGVTRIKVNVAPKAATP